MAKQEYRTDSRTRILAYLISVSDRSVSVSDIKAYMEQEGCPVSVTTIYRYLDRLLEQGRVNRYAAGETGRATYQYVDEGRGCDEHLHLKCVTCGSVEHLDCRFMKEITSHISKEHGFSLQYRDSVIYGVCRECRNKQKV